MSLATSSGRLECSDEPVAKSGHIFVQPDLQLSTLGVFDRRDRCAFDVKNAGD